jgi:glyoxylase-like metal-dependent hydrolase (beta-lactamase superfamily II)
MGAEVAIEILKGIWRFNDQYFYGEPVGVYLIELDSEIILFDLPSYSVPIKEFIQSFKKPAICYLSHGSTGIADGSIWQKEINLEVRLHKSDSGYRWLRMKPDVLFVKLENNKEYQIIHTPGHSLGSICLLHKPSGALFTGDTIAGEGGQIRPSSKSTHDDNPELRVASINKLMRKKFKHILPFHFDIIMS